MFIRFDIFLHCLPKPNTTLLLYPALGPAINIGGVFLQKNQIKEIVLKFKTTSNPRNTIFFKLTIRNPTKKQERRKEKNIC